MPFGPCTADEADAVMYYQYRGILRKLAGDDIAGISSLYLAESAPVPSSTPQPAATPTPFPELTVVVERGWNLAVLPPGPVAAVTNILTCVEALYSYEKEAWRAWIRGVSPQLQAITQIEPNRAYWLLASSTCAHIFP